MGVIILEENILGKRMRFLREKHDCKQNKVAKDLSITPYQLSRYESGYSKPDPELIAKISTYYDVTTDYLLGSTDNPNKAVESDRERIMHKIATDFPNIDLMFHDLEGMSAEDLQDVYDFIKFKKSQSDNK